MDLFNDLKSVDTVNLRQVFADDEYRGKKYSFTVGDLLIDLSKNLITDDIVAKLVDIANKVNLKQKISDQFSGKHINTTEDRAVLHTALRRSKNDELLVDGQNVIADVHDVLSKMKKFCACEHKGITGKPITTIVNIGIGGSDLGPSMAYEALKPYAKRQARFISNVDPSDMFEKINDLDIEQTLFVIVSKTFTTQETLANAKAVREYFLNHLSDDIDHAAAIATHFVAVSTALDEVKKFGINEKNVFGFWDWVGGRYSVDSAVGLSLMLSIGSDNFMRFLEGFRKIDQYFLETDLSENAVALMGLINTYYINVLGYSSHAVLPYCQYLHRFPAYLQQLTMESNGKTVTAKGGKIDYATGEIYFGEPGTNGQHAFYQLIHQGSQIIPCDFIAFARNPHDFSVDNTSMHELLLSNFLAQSKALAFGKTRQEVEAEGTCGELVNAKIFTGNRPSTSIMARELSPSILGQLIALYEHITFTEGAIWQINSFDQWGVQLGKVLANQIIDGVKGDEKIIDSQDSSTKNLIKFYHFNNS